jgi:GntR family transcriptional regulator
MLSIFFSRAEILEGAYNMIDKNNPIPLYLQLKEHLMEQITVGKYPLGSQLPTEKALIKQLKLGRATVRAAVEELERDGIIVKRHGIGSFVAYKSGSLGFEPLISLSYVLKTMGLKSTSQLEYDKDVVVTSGELGAKWQVGSTVRQLRRVRFASGIAVGLEDDYFTKELYTKIEGGDFTASLARLLLEEGALQVERIEQTMLLRAPSAEEQASLGAGENERVLELTRWLYAQGISTPVNYVRFVVIHDLLQVPFEIFRKNKARKLQQRV